MGKSYRKPYCTDGFKGSKKRQFFKRYANKTIRHAEGVPDGKAFKKFYCSYDICDFNFYDDEAAQRKGKFWRTISK